MESISTHVGTRIKYFRKKKGITLDQFASMINKSTATISKYERGIISIDIETLWRISNQLDIGLPLLLDYKSEKKKNSPLANLSFINDENRLHVYSYDGYRKKLKRSLLQVHDLSMEAAELTGTLYYDMQKTDDYHKCKHLYHGRVESYDLVTYLILENSVNPIEKVSMYILNPLHQEEKTFGLMSGIYDNPFMPIAIRFMAAKHAIDDSAFLEESLVLSKYALKEIKHYNMFLCNENN